jgi:hypothetical protein
MEYYLRFTVEDPLLSVEVIEPPEPPVLDRVEVLGDGSVLIEFSATPGASYTVQYSDDHLQTWNTAVPSLTAVGNRLQWADSGPPRTSAHPGVIPARFYRVFQSNP